MFVQKVASSPFLKLLFTKVQRNTRIEGYYGSLIGSVESFQVSRYYNAFKFIYPIQTRKMSSLVDTSAWRAANYDAYVTDQQTLNDRLRQLENNRQRLKDMLSKPGGRLPLKSC